MIHEGDLYPRPLSLLFVRHAEAEPSTAPTREADDVRPLTERGRKQARSLGISLRNLEFVPAIILTSPLVRARQTAAILRESAFGDTAIETVDALRMGKCTGDRLVKPLLTTLKQIQGKVGANDPEDSSQAGAPPLIAIVGHQPDLGRLILDLLAPPHPDTTQSSSGEPNRAMILKKGSALILTWRSDDAPGYPPVLDLALQPKQARILAQIKGSN